MHPAIKLLTATLGLGLTGIALGAQSPGALGERIEKVIKADRQNVSRGIVVQQVSTGQVIYEHNADELLSPASVTKVITAAAVLHKLTPGYLFKTRWYRTGTMIDGTISGDLIVVGDGDPFIVSEKLWQLAADLKNMGVDTIKGDLVIDNGVFDDEGRDVSRTSGANRSRNAYDAPVSAFAVNFNTLAFIIAPGDKADSSARVSFDPYAITGMRIDNRVRTGRSGSANSLQIERQSMPDGGAKFVATGSIGGEALPQKLYRSVGEQTFSNGEIIRAFLKGAGVKWDGKTRLGALPKSAKLLYELDSYPMSQIVGGLNKFSNNFIADMLVKRLGATFYKEGSLSNGMRVVEEFLRDGVGIKTKFELRNGSGLNTENRITARQVGALLKYMESRFDLYPEFLASMPAAGLDGTLAKRFKDKKTALAKGLIRAKTGTLTEPISVASLAGYLRDPELGLLAFVMIDNGITNKAQPSIEKLRLLQDEVLATILAD